MHKYALHFDLLIVHLLILSIAFGFVSYEADIQLIDIACVNKMHLNVSGLSHHRGSQENGGDVSDMINVVKGCFKPNRDMTLAVVIAKPNGECK